MTAAEMRQHLHAERLALRQRQLALRQQQRSIGQDLDAVQARLAEVDHCFGLLGGE